jgi:hypothetical protein
MGLFSGSFESDHNEVHNKGSYTHDALGGAVAYEAFKAYEDHLAANGRPDSHAKAKEILAGLVGAAVTQLAETKGRDAFDSYKQKQAEQNARERIKERLSQEYN